MSRRVIVLIIAVSASAVAALAESSASQPTPESFVIVLKDGHQKSFPIADVTRIEFKNGAMVLDRDGKQESISVADIISIDFQRSANTSPLGRNHFLGKWKVGDGNGGKFYITLERDGHARKTIGSTHGTWVVVDGEARIAWDDGWHDVIRKMGSKHEKFAYEPGKSVDDTPSNVTDARNLEAEPI